MLNNFNEINCENSFSKFGVEASNWFIGYQLFVKYIPIFCGISKFFIKEKKKDLLINQTVKILEGR